MGMAKKNAKSRMEEDEQYHDLLFELEIFLGDVTNENWLGRRHGIILAILISTP